MSNDTVGNVMITQEQSGRNSERDRKRFLRTADCFGRNTERCCHVDGRYNEKC